VPSTQHFVTTWFYAEESGEESNYPQVGGKSSTQSFQDVYLKSVAVFFASSHRNNPTTRHVLFTNRKEPLRLGSGYSISEFLGSLDVEIVILPMTFATPEGYFHSWRNQFYVFDILQHASSMVADDDTFLLLDSDCVFIQNQAEMVSRIRNQGALTYNVGFEDAEHISGMTIREMREVFRDLDPGLNFDDVPYLGGEIIAVTGRTLREINGEFRQLWPRLLTRHAAGERKLNEEAQCLSYIYTRLGVSLGSANPFIDRIWTCLPPKPVTADEADFQLTIWHVPAEKRYGLSRLFERVISRQSDYWETPIGPSFARYLGKFLGIPKRTPTKAIFDLRDGILYQARKYARGA
jgi:hypothetical protein